MKKPSPVLRDFLLLFAFTAFLIWPLFKLKWSASWGSIESTFISDARYLADNWPHPLWYPIWYGGTRFDYVYPPALRYGSALILKSYSKLTPSRAYHLYVAFLYCIGIAGVFLLVRVIGGTRAGAWGAALASTLVSPAFLFLADARKDAAYGTPQRLGVLMRYGEGPHISALAWLPIALAASYLALREKRPAMTALAGIACALVVSNNFYGATSLAIWFPIVVWGVWITGQDRTVFLRAAAVVGLAYGLTSFWLVPSYLTVTLANMRLVSEEGNRWSLWLLVAVGVIFIVLSDRWAKGRPERFYPVFTAGSLLFFGLNVLGNRFLNFRVLGEPFRLVPELDLALVLAAVFLVERFRASGARWKKGIAVAVILIAAAPAARFLKNSRRIYPRDPEPQERIEYKISKWFHDNMPESRVMVCGSVRFWYNAWFNGQQLGGGSEQGTLNQMSNVAQARVIGSDDPKEAVDWLQSFGVDAFAVHGPQSQEVYHDFDRPKKFEGKLPVLFDNGAGDVIYQVPRRFPGLARVVDRTRMNSVPAISTLYPNCGSVALYAAAVERGPNAPASTRWDGTDALEVRARIEANQSVLVMISYDPYWRAYSQGRILPMRQDVMGQILIDTPPGEHQIRMVFKLPIENIIGRVIFGIALLITGWLLIAGRRRPGEVAA